MKYARRGRYLDSADGKWVIIKDYVTKDYTLYNKETHKEVTEGNGITIRRWGYLRDVKEYIEKWS